MLRSESRVGRTWRGGAVAGVALLAAAAGVVVGCASTPTGEARMMQPGDFKMLSGKWTGSEHVQQASPQAIEGVIQETGAFSIVPRGVPGAQRPGIMKVVDGGVVYEMAQSKGKMTFHESQDGKSWVWKWDGKTADGGAVRNELTKSK
jgi:hypothetical protein